jgi:C-terminal processing protease CtpA/Prc
MSSSEHFAACLQAIGRAAIVGERSPGYLLGAKWIKLPNGLSFMHSFLQPIPFGGCIVEGHGIKPDLEIRLNRNDLLMGKDNQLEAAIAYILGKNEQ